MYVNFLPVGKLGCWQSILSSHWHFQIPSALSLAEQQLQKPEQLDTHQGGSVLGHLQLQFEVPEREQYIQCISTGTYCITDKLTTYFFVVLTACMWSARSLKNVWTIFSSETVGSVTISSVMEVLLLVKGAIFSAKKIPVVFFTEQDPLRECCKLQRKPTP